MWHLFSFVAITFDETAQFEGDGYIEVLRDIMPHEAGSIEETIELTFTTRQTDGIILWHSQAPTTPAEGKDFVALLIEKGKVVFT